MLKVGLYGAEFFAQHGFYEQERITGNRFMVDAEVEFVPATDLNADELSHTVNYEQLYAIVQQEMAQTKKLLETVAQSIADKIKAQFPFVVKLTVTLKKQNPPLQGKVDYSAVTISLP
jgi:7,8-dihydroneopterin aldolase/epimerase/oxygenase